jgi:hypothetical protein
MMAPEGRTGGAGALKMARGHVSEWALFLLTKEQTGRGWSILCSYVFDQVYAAIPDHRSEVGASAEEQAVHAFVTELLDTKVVSDGTFGAARDLLGNQGVRRLAASLMTIDRAAGREPPRT